MSPSAEPEIGVKTRMLVVGHQSLTLHYRYEPRRSSFGVAGISMDPAELCQCLPGTSTSRSRAEAHRSSYSRARLWRARPWVTRSVETSMQLR